MDTLVQELEQTAKSAQAASYGRETQTNRSVTPGRSTKTRTRMLIVGALAIVAAATTEAYLHFRDRVSTDDAQVDAHIAPIAPKISGNISEILVDDNQAVKAGQVLLRIDPRDYQAKVAQARGALAAAEGQSAGARVGVPLTTATTTSGTSAAQAQLAAASADYERAKTDYERASSSELAMAQADVDSKRATSERARADRARMEPLAAQDEISKLQFDAYLATARVAESDLVAAQQKLANAGSQAQGTKASMEAAFARISAAQAALEQAQANRQQVNISSAQAGTATGTVLEAKASLEAAELQLSYTTIVAPIDGVVTRKAVQLGQIVQPGQSLLTIVPLKDVWISANFKETQLSNVRSGQRAEVHVDMYGRSFEGRVDSVAGATGARLSLLPPENATGNYVKIVQRIPVKIALDSVPDGFVFRPGMNVDATIFTK
jgi:membrane fusion protein (multidrug efflux system)